jgi:CubicO group peptidase (beta-lactamase class C family)
MKIPASILFLFPACCSLAQVSEKLDSIFSEQDPTKPGLAFLIEERGKIIYQKTVGLSNSSTGERITNATHFRMASVTKQFTAMGILLLEKDRKISLEDPILRFFPEIPKSIGKKVLIRHLLTHTSGLLDYESLIPPTQTDQVLDKDVLHLLEGQDSTYFPPGTKFRYSNTGFCLLSLIIESVSHQSFASFIQDRIFKPLQMKESFVYESKNPRIQRAMGYAKDDQGHILFSDQSLTSATQGDGGVYTSINDYLKWAHALEENKFLDLEAVLDRIRFPLGGKTETYYGAGWFDAQWKRRVLFHSGSSCGFNNFVILIPKEKCTVIYFSNLAENLEPFRSVMKAMKEMGNPEFSDLPSFIEWTQ